MIYLLLGKDDFSKKEFFETLAAKEGVGKNLIFDFDESSSQEDVLQAVQSGGGLFGGSSGAKLLRLKNLLSSGKFQENILDALEEAAKNSRAIAVFFEEALDKRKSETKKILARKDIKILQFDIPQGAAFGKWIDARAEKYGVKFKPGAREKFLKNLGGDAALAAAGFSGASSVGSAFGASVGFKGGSSFGASELYDLWQADSELKKLSIFAGALGGADKNGETGASANSAPGAREISAEDVENLVGENIDDNIFQITNAIGDKNRAQTTKLLIDYLDRIAEGDDKSKIIGLSALLADQLRNILLVQGLLAEKAGDAAVVRSTGFSPGRVFVYKKLARNLDAKKTADALRKLELLDEEIKTSDAPANLLFFMIVRDLI